MVGRSRDAFRATQTPWGMVQWGATRDFSYPERNGAMVHSKILRPRREWCNDAILRPRREDGRYQRFLRPRKEWCSGVFKDTQTRRNWCTDASASLPEDAEPCHRPRRMRSVRAQDLVVLAGPSGLSLQVRSLSCAMSGERVGGSSRETRGAIEARGDGASDDVLGF